MARLFGALLHLVDNLHHLGFRNRSRAILSPAHKTCDLVGVLDQMPGVIVHDHFDQHVTREELALGGLLLAILDFNHFLHGHQDATKLVLHAGTNDALTNIALNRLFHSGISVHHIPAQIRVHRGSRNDFCCGIFYNIGHYFFHPKIKS